MIGVRSPAGARRGRPAPTPFPANAGIPLPPADNRHSRWWRAQYHKTAGGLVQEERDRGSLMAIGPQTVGREITMPPSDTAGQSVDVAGWARKTAGSGWRCGVPVETLAGNVMGGCNRRLDAGYRKSTGPQPCVWYADHGCNEANKRW